MYQKLLTADIKRKLPKLYANDGKSPSATPIVVKFFDPCSYWTWYATEFDGEDTFFGFVAGHEGELGYFSLSELAGIKNALGIGIERDMHFGNHTLAEVMNGGRP